MYLKTKKQIKLNGKEQAANEKTRMPNNENIIIERKEQAKHTKTRETP